MQRPHPAIFTLQRLMSELAQVDRNHHHLNNERSENDIEHSYSVAMLCWYIWSTQNLALDMEKVFKYSLVHDFVEVYAGDVNTFASKSDRAAKIQSEAQALTKLETELSEFPDMISHLKAYERKSDPESLFVWTVDKLQALILADLDHWRPYQKINISYETFIRKHHEQLAQCSPYCREIFTTLLEYFKTTYYDRPLKQDHYSR